MNENNKKNIASIDINFVKALCNICENYESFEKDLNSLIFPNMHFNLSKCIRNTKSIIRELCHITNNVTSVKSKSVCDFYKKYILVLNKITQFISIEEFINIIYLRNHNQITSLNNYILKNKDNLDKILTNLNKLSELGFEKLVFDESLDFTGDIYKLPARLGGKVYLPDTQITYLENMELIPSLDGIKYKTTASNYKIIVGARYEFIYISEIFMNDLTIDSSRLPNAITEDEIVGKIRRARLDNRKMYQDLRDAIILNSEIGILKDELEHFIHFVEHITLFNQNDDKISNGELLKLFQEIRERLMQAKSISDEYSNKLLDDNQCITEELLEEEQKIYIKERQKREFWCS